MEVYRYRGRLKRKQGEASDESQGGIVVGGGWAINGGGDREAPPGEVETPGEGGPGGGGWD